MFHQSSKSAALDFLKEWEEGHAPLLQDYLTSVTGDVDDTLDLVADCVIFEALARHNNLGMPLIRLRT